MSRPTDADLLREMICFAARRLMELEIESLTGASYGEKSCERLVQRKRLPTEGQRFESCRYSQQKQ